MLYRTRRYGLIGLLAFLGVTSVAGGLGLLFEWIEPGLDQIEGSAFDSYVIPGLALLVLVGGCGLLAMAAETVRHELAHEASFAAGMAILIFETVEIFIVEIHWLQFLYFGVGIAIAALALAAWAEDHLGEERNTMKNGRRPGGHGGVSIGLKPG